MFPLDELELLCPLTPSLEPSPLPLLLPPASEVLLERLDLSSAVLGWACSLGPRALRLELPSFHLGTRLILLEAELPMVLLLLGRG